MKSTTDIQFINRKLRDHFGLDTETTQSIFRVVWSTDQYENRMSDVTPEGVQLLYPQVQLFPKYYVGKDRWILERLVVIPIANMTDLPDAQLSYEPIWVFENDFGPVEPKWEPIKFIIDALYAAMGRSSLAKYANPDDKNPEARMERINKLGQELFGNETSVGDALAHHEAVAYTGPSKIEEN